MKNAQVTAVAAKQEKKIVESKALATMQVAELGKASELTLGNGKWGHESFAGKKPFYVIG